MQENTFDIGWTTGRARRIYGTARHVSATQLQNNFAPHNLRVALADLNPNHPMWRAAYDDYY